MKSKGKILLTNSYAVNNGDMALVLALYDELKARGYSVSIATFHFEFLKRQYPNLPFIREILDRKSLKGGTIVKKLFLRINYIFNKAYQNHDIYIGSPGGYMNSFYGLKRCLLPLVEAKRRGKKTAVYSQSIGPLNERDQRLLTRYSQSIDVILVRDDYSRECINSIQIFSKVFQTKDAAFLLPPRTSKAHPDCKTVAVSVREWNYENRDMNNFTQMIQSFCEQVLTRGFNVEFISTCQGVPNYRDDSQIALKIKQQIITSNPSFEKRIVVDRDYHTFHDLADRLNSNYCFTIGTRLHMCILSLINGTPAFNISYEVKGRECYKYLGLENYSVDYNESKEAASDKFKDFFENYSMVQASLQGKLGPVHAESKASLDKFIQEMNI